jgi:superfamily II DNA or RNA helicase
MTTTSAAPRELRDYQSAAADAIESEWAKGNTRTGVVLPTGSGKSTVIGERIRRDYRAGAICWPSIRPSR